MKKIISIICLICVSVTVLCSCTPRPQYKAEHLNKIENTVSVEHKFSSNDNSQTVQANSQKVNDYINYISNQRVEYGYKELFNVEKTLEGMYSGNTVTKHSANAFDSNGKLTKEHLFEIVQANTKTYIENEKVSIIKEITDKEFLMGVCEIIVDTVNYHLQKYPDIDKARVGCVLGNLKIVTKRSATDFAAVEPNLVLHLNPTTSDLAGLLTKGDMYSVLIHETIHILQYGCLCENNKDCERRVGFAYYHESWKQNWADCSWLAEGSAERMMTLYSNVEPMTYQNMVNYIVSFDLATMFQKNMPVNYIETLNFQNNPTKLFEAFQCKNDSDKEEVVKMLYGFNISFMEPIDAKKAYEEYYGVELKDEELSNYQETIKRPVVQLITKNYYHNLAQLLLDKELSKNDLYFMVALFEGTINYHIGFDNPEKDEYNKEFSPWYSDVRSKFFECVKNADEDEYLDYSENQNESTINAGMKWLSEEQKEFLLRKFENISTFARVGK